MVASLRFPDTGTRMAVLDSGRPAKNSRGYVYADEACTVVAEAYADVDGVKGALLPVDELGRRYITLSAYGEQPYWWGPADGTSVLWLRVNGVASRVDADYGPRIGDVTAQATQTATVVGSLAAEVAQTAGIVEGLGTAATLNVGTGTGTVAAGDDTRITGAVQAAQNLADLSSAATARTNLGLGNAATRSVGSTTGTVAAGDDTRITGSAQKTANLSDLANAATARTNLGLGNAATRSVGTGTGTVAAGDDTRLISAGILVSQQAGATDQAKITAALTAAAPFGATVLLDGTLNLTGQIPVPAGARIDGSRAVLNQTADLAATFFVNNAPGVVIRNVRANGRATDYVAGSSVLTAAAVYISGTSSNVLVEGCDFRGFAGVGVYIGAGVSDVRVVNCRLQGPGPDEITPLTNNYGMGVVGGDGASNWSVTGCDISLYAQGINSGDVSNVRITNNYIHDMTGQHGIYLDSVFNLIIANNMVRDTSLQGIKVQIANFTTGQDIDHVTITGNVVTNVGSHAILLTKAVTGSRQTRRTTITGNTLSTTGAGGDGINLIGVHGATIVGNIVHNARHGINTLTCQGLTVGFNRFHTLQMNGALFTDTNDVEFVYNRVIDPASDNLAGQENGIRLAGSSSSYRIVGNVVTDANGHMRYGLYLVTTAQDTIVVRDNDLSGATDYAARLDNTQGLKEWANNTLSGGIGAVTGFPTTLVVQGPPRKFSGPAAPTTGTYRVGDIVWNTAPVAAGVVGWVCVTAGTPGVWSQFGDRPAPSWTNPTTNALKGATFDPVFANAGAGTTTAGTLLVARVPLDLGGQISIVDYMLTGAGVGLTAGQCAIGVYSSAGALLGQTLDLSVDWTTAGQKSANLAAPTAARPPGSFVWVAFLWNGTTAPQLRGITPTAALVNVALTSSGFRFASAGSGLTALPDPLPALSASTQAAWFGLR